MSNAIAKILAVGAGAMAMTVALPSVAHAGTETGRITELHVRGDGLVYFQLNGTHQSRPHCARDYEYWMIDETTEVGRKQYAMLLVAAQSGLRLRISGANTCTRWGDGEDVRELTILR